jgi:hypothetical protein
MFSFFSPPSSFHHPTTWHDIFFLFFFDPRKVGDGKMETLATLISARYACKILRFCFHFAVTPVAPGPDMLRSDPIRHVCVCVCVTNPPRRF